MDYAIRILLEEKVNIENELSIIDKQERREPQERRLISIVNALNKLNIDDVNKQRELSIDFYKWMCKRHDYQQYNPYINFDMFVKESNFNCITHH